MGFSALILAITLSSYVIYNKLLFNNPVRGWTSLLVAISFFSGLTLTSLGVIAEYLAVTMGIVMGKPLYMISTKPTRPQ
jgi:hypothetical protein